MGKVKRTKLTVPQREGEDPPIEVTIRTYSPSVTSRKSKEPIDYGVTEDQFNAILKRAAQPINKPKKHK